jgi:hypothetical protein
MPARRMWPGSWRGCGLPAENVIVLETGEVRWSAATVNRHLAAVFGFYDYHARAGVGVAAFVPKQELAAANLRTLFSG